MEQITITGHVGQDAVIRNTNGRNVISFSVAVNDSYTNGQGQKVEKTNWYDVAIWKEAGQSLRIADYLKKGQQVLVQGKPEARCYQITKGANAGQWVAAVSIQARSTELLGSSQKTEQPAAAGAAGQQRPAPVAADDDNALPF